MITLDKIARRLANTLRLGKLVASTTETNGIQQMQVYKSPCETHQHMSYQTPGLTTRPVPQNTSVAIVQQGGDANRAIIVAANDPTSRWVGVEEGESVLHSCLSASDSANNYVRIAVGGHVIIVAATDVTITAPNIVVNGNIQVNGSIKTTGDVVANGISLESHIHGGVQSGGNTTGTPEG